MAVITGHCEITDGVNQPIVVGCAIGIAENGEYVTSRGTESGNQLILTKEIGIEGTAILASDRKNELRRIFSEDFIKEAENFFKDISIVKEALIAYETGGVQAMHDPTEGGIAGGLHELADANKLGFRIYEERIKIRNETEEICKHFEINPLQLISSGCLLIATKKEKSKEILANIHKSGVKAEIIGEMTESTLGRKIITKGVSKDLLKPETDQLWYALKKKI
jgi:hydrogenase maturation factor